MESFIFVLIKLYSPAPGLAMTMNVIFNDGITIENDVKILPLMATKDQC